MNVKVKFFESERYFDKYIFVFRILKCNINKTMIEIELLEKYDAMKAIQKVTIFEKDHLATHYYQIISEP
jgi:hypothetical protein